MGAVGPKLLLEVAGRTALARVVESFLRVGGVGEIVAVVPADLRSRAEGALAAIPNPRRVRLAAAAGGATRQESVRLGLAALSMELPYVAVHDVARVLVRPALIERVLEAARATGAAIPTLPIADSVKEISGGRVVRSLPRERLEGAQTPQIFARDIILRSHARALERGESATDDAALVERIGEPVAAVEGDPANVKVTSPSDVMLLEALLRSGFQTEA